MREYVFVPDEQIMARCIRAEETRDRAERRRNLMYKRLGGLGMLVVSALAIWIASTGTTIIERDATVVLLTIPMGLSMLLSRR